MELLKGMCDINDHVRLSAVSACSKAFLNKKVMEAKRKAKRKIPFFTFKSSFLGGFYG